MVCQTTFIFAVSFLLAAMLPSSECVRCYECRSDVLRNCGDPFFPGNVPAIECTQITTKPTLMCFKTSQYVGGQYITVRGCAPFDTDTFSQSFQRSVGGTYWKGQNSFSLCDYDNCNGAAHTNARGLWVIMTVAAAISRVLQGSRVT